MKKEISKEHQIMKKEQISKEQESKEQISKFDIDEILMQLLNLLPALQSDIWKKMKIDSKKCSRLMKTLEDKGIIKRTKVKGGTYMVEMVGINKSVKETRFSVFSALLSDSGRFSPCTMCKLDCNPAMCCSISNWVLDINE